MNALPCWDFGEIEQICEEFYNETKPLGGFNFAHLQRSWEEIVIGGHGQVFVVYDEDDEVVGVAGILLAPGLYADFWYCQEAMLYVTLRCRGRTWAGAALYRAMENWARSKGAEFLTMVEDPKSPVNYGRHGYVLVERNWVKPLRKAG